MASAAPSNDNGFLPSPARRPGRFHQDRGDGRAAAAAARRLLGVLSPPTANTPSRRCSSSEQCSYGGRVFGRAFDPSQMLGDSCWRRSASCATTCRSASSSSRRRSSTASRTTAGSTISPRISAHRRAVDGASVGGGFRLGWLTTYTADVRGSSSRAGLPARQARSTGPTARSTARFFFILRREVLRTLR